MKVRDILKTETADFKSKYIEMIADWARKEFCRNVARAERYSKAHLAGSRALKSETGIEGVDFFIMDHDEYYKEQRFYWNTPSWKFEDKARFVKKAKEDASANFDNKIEKLALRIEKKGLDIERLEKTKTTWLDPNLNIEFSDGLKKVKAWTIIASGPIQKPHYRYLVK